MTDRYEKNRDYDIVPNKRSQTIGLIIIIFLFIIAVVIVFLLLRRNNTSSSGSSGSNVGAACATNLDCTGAAICNTTTKTCVECVSDDNCNLNKPVCDTSTSTCVACLKPSDCPASRPICNLQAKQCIQCTDNSQCSGVTSLCDTSSNTCVGCLNDANCPISEPFCNGATKRCVECVNDSQCGALTCNNGACCSLSAPVITALNVGTFMGQYLASGTFNHIPALGLTEIYRVSDGNGNFLFDVASGSADGNIQIPQGVASSIYANKMFFSNYTYQIVMALSSACGVTPFSNMMSINWPVQTPNSGIPVITGAYANTSVVSVLTSNPKCSDLIFWDLTIFASQTPGEDPNSSFKIIMTVDQCVNPMDSNSNILTSGSWVMPVSSGQTWYIRVARQNTGIVNDFVLLSAPVAIVIS